MMSRTSKREYLDEIFFWYKYAKTKPEKNDLINQASKICKYHRKHIIRLLNRHKKPLKPKSHKKRGRRSKYFTPEVIVILHRIWLTANMPCGKRFKAIIGLWLPAYIQEYGSIEPFVEEKLLSISAATLDRLLVKERKKHKHKGRCTTKPGTLLKKHIPIKTEQWDETRPGFLEADTVAHCGDTLIGDFIYTIDTVDIATGWTEQRAIFRKEHQAVLEQIKDIEQSIPFKLLGFDCDNGSEFLNWHLLRYFEYPRTNPVMFTRSRPYHKDDNAHIEQKNWTHVRHLFGYHRLDNPQAVELMNDLYKNEWRAFHNFFSPSVKLISKKQVSAKTIKKYDSPKTPYQRLMESKDIDRKTKDNLKAQLASLNPFMLKRVIEGKLDKIMALCQNRRPRRKRRILVKSTRSLGNI